MLVQGNGPSKIILNIYGNYLAGNYYGEECRTGSEDLIVEEKRDGFIILIAIFIEYPVPFIQEFFEKLLAINYPKKQIHLFIHNEIPYHSKHVDEFTDKADREEYISMKVVDGQGVLRNNARDFAVNHCLNVNCDYLFSLDASAHIINENTLLELIMYNKSIIAPMMNRRGSVYANFWGAVGPDNFYLRSFDYLGIINSEVQGLWNVPFISLAYLMKASILSKVSYTKGDEDPDLVFCQNLRDQDIFMYVTNFNFYGFLINNEMFDETKIHPEFYELFTNRYEWHYRYIHPDYKNIFEKDYVQEQPCQDVFTFPLVKEIFTKQLIEIMENNGKWANQSNVEDGNEIVPTRDILLKNVDLDEIWLEFLNGYVRPLTHLVYPGRQEKESRSVLNYVVRYKPNESYRLRSYWDATAFVVNIVLSQSGFDFQGGGFKFSRFVKFNRLKITRIDIFLF